MIFLKLFWEFFKVGLFAVGGGLATLPFLYEIANKTGWFDAASIIDMIAVSESTPGPIGVNMATYTGFKIHGVIGGITATFGLVLPSIIVAVLVQIFITKFKESKNVQNIFGGLRPASMALVTSAGIGVVTSCLIFPKLLLQGNFADGLHIKGIIFAVVLFYLMRKYKKHPVLYIALSALAGIIIGF
ncbi:MAG: chromate transporter [Firmicutes bacterium]|nr:chromate transporter [Bacillota bacterium]